MSIGNFWANLVLSTFDTAARPWLRPAADAPASLHAPYHQQGQCKVRVDRQLLSETAGELRVVFEDGHGKRQTLVEPFVSDTTEPIELRCDLRPGHYCVAVTVDGDRYATGLGLHEITVEADAVARIAL